MESSLLDEIKKNNISKTDCVGNFSMYCSKEPKDEFSKTVRGVIFENEKLVHRGLHYSEDVDIADEECIGRLLSEKFRPCLSHEGTVLKMIYFGCQWNMTTHRRFDATKSKWGNARPFGMIFKDAIVDRYFESYDAFLDALDRKKHYHFLLKSTEETRIVVRPDPVDPVVLTAVTCADTFGVLPLERVGDIPVAKTLTFDDAAAVVDFVSRCDPFVAQGLMFFSADMMQSFRVANPRYLKLSSVRDNIASLHLCYACNRLKEEERKLFLEIYPTGNTIAQLFETTFKNFAASLHALYRDRHVFKKQFYVSNERHSMLVAIHQIYRKRLRGRVAVSVDDVEAYLNSRDPRRLYAMLRSNSRRQ